MRDLNHWTGTGRMVADAEMTYTATGQALTKFSVCVNKSRKVNDVWTDFPSFFDVSCWGKLAELAAWLKKGERIMLEGRPEQQRWETKEGKKRSAVMFTAEHIEKLGFIEKGTSVQSPTDEQPTDSPY